MTVGAIGTMYLIFSVCFLLLNVYDLGQAKKNKPYKEIPVWNYLIRILLMPFAFIFMMIVMMIPNFIYGELPFYVVPGVWGGMFVLGGTVYLSRIIWRFNRGAA